MAVVTTYTQGEERIVEISSAKGTVAYRVPSDWTEKDADVAVGIAKHAMHLGSIDGTIEELIAKMVTKAVEDRSPPTYFAKPPVVTYLDTEKEGT